MSDADDTTFLGVALRKVVFIRERKKNTYVRKRAPDVQETIPVQPEAARASLRSRFLLHQSSDVANP